MGELVVPVPDPKANRYFTVVDATLANNTHALQLQLVGHDNDVLELGCAAGHMTRALRDEGCRVVAVEVDAEAAQFAEEFAERVIVEDLSQPEALATLGEATFDVVLAGDVLEHLPDPLTLLRRCRKLLRPDGYLVASVPNIAHVDVRLALLHGRWQYRDWGLLDRTHLRFFTRLSLNELLHTAGFAPVEIRRVVRPPGTTEFAEDMQPVNASALDVALEDPEAETYQFVVRAILDVADPVAKGAHSRLELVELVELEIARRRGLEAELATMTSDFYEAQQMVDVLLSSRTFRYTERPRRVFARLRRASVRR